MKVFTPVQYLSKKRNTDFHTHIEKIERECVSPPERNTSVETVGMP